MPNAAVITPVIIDAMISLLVPLFVPGRGGDLVAARQIAARLLANYNAETEEELRLAAEIIGFAFTALDALARSMAPDLTLNQVIRLRGLANSQHRSANQCQRTLDKLRLERRVTAAKAAIKKAVETTVPETATPDIASDQPLTVETLKLSDFQPPVLSRQQRRAAERQAEKQKRRQAEQARLAALRAAREKSTPPIAA
jgi:hypothetical protein